MMKRLLVSLFAVMGVMFIDMAKAANYTVGAPNGGWDQSTDLTTWPSSLTFFQGDNLVFLYTTNHDVTEVSKPDFDSCTATNPMQPPHTGGDAVIPLTSAGDRYFICGTAGHCLSGMKLQITTLAASAPPPATTPAVPSPPPTPSPKRPVPSPPSKTVAPSPSPPKHSKEVSPSPSASAPPPSGSSLPFPPPAPSSGSKIDVMGALTGLILMIFVINV
ncbi:hypothetical protein C2S53_004698 [Perilla frutescens var. hirtella]|uniref:Phytocyanin domain-containing protein n=1 Tax=Perilla frutescens var. hirtella TaxID=608512 RepID=A0AAD4J4S4_PERFH|nr:hypothetical protein C2S53_004698 [Perilla frutescens var. hirtella]